MASRLYRGLKWLYNTFKMGYFAPLLILISYTLLGAIIFKALEHDEDQRRRNFYRNESEYAVNQVLDRMLEVRCHDGLLKQLNRVEQIRHAQDALFWFLDHLNLTAVIEERSDASPWTWWGSMFYAGQLYTTIGYGFPIVKTVPGQVVSIFYIMIGIPIFLIILKDVGRLMSRGPPQILQAPEKLADCRDDGADTQILTVVQGPGISQFQQTLKIDLGTESEALATEEKEQRILALNGRSKIEKAELDPVKQNRLNQRAEMSFPIPIALAILSMWILFSAALFCIWETEWGYLTSVYFFFVSISTVGLGDIYPSKPDMMIFNFILILVGLALLSMCFNLIQLTVERFLDRLIDEYIEEIEKMADIVHQDDPATEHAMPFEFKMTTGNLLQVPFRKVAEPQGLFSEVKSFVAEKIAENLIASRLGDEDSDSERDKEEAEEEEVADYKGQADDGMADDVEKTGSAAASRKGSVTGQLFHSPRRVQKHAKRPVLRTIQTLEKIRPHRGDFRSVVFSKFVASDRLARLMEDPARTQSDKKKTVSISCQTEPEPKMRRLCGRKSRDSISTVNTCDSIISTTPYKDIYFDYTTDISANEAALNNKSTLSILRIDDEEPILQSALMRLRSPPKIRLPAGLPSGSRRFHRPLRPTPSSPGCMETDNSMRDSGGPSPLHDTRSLPSSEFTRLQNLCGLLPNDFTRQKRRVSLDSPSHGYRSNSSIDDSMFEKAKEPSNVQFH
ncbi:unnamed protein product, partial [Mesorhabditis spiculigera]